MWKGHRAVKERAAEADENTQWAGVADEMFASWPGFTHLSSQARRWGSHPHQPHGPTHAPCTEYLAPAHPAQPLWPLQKRAGIFLDHGLSARRSCIPWHQEPCSKRW